MHISKQVHLGSSVIFPLRQLVRVFNDKLPLDHTPSIQLRTAQSSSLEVTACRGNTFPNSNYFQGFLRPEKWFSIWMELKKGDKSGKICLGEYAPKGQFTELEDTTNINLGLAFESNLLPNLLSKEHQASGENGNNDSSYYIFTLSGEDGKLTSFSGSYLSLNSLQVQECTPFQIQENILNSSLYILPTAFQHIPRLSAPLSPLLLELLELPRYLTNTK